MKTIRKVCKHRVYSQSIASRTVHVNRVYESFLLLCVSNLFVHFASFNNVAFDQMAANAFSCISCVEGMRRMIFFSFGEKHEKALFLIRSNSIKSSLEHSLESYDSTSYENKQSLPKHLILQCLAIAFFFCEKIALKN